MANIRLRYPVYTLDQTPLLPAGTILSEKSLHSLVWANERRPYKLRTLFSHGTIKKDVLHFIRQPPYRIIFADKKQNTKLLNLLDRVLVVSPILESLDYFRQYDFYTYRHILIVLALTTLICQDLVVDYQELMQEIAAGAMHDIGKICVPMQILKKNSPLTQTERAILEHHAAAGFVLLCYYHQDSQHLAAIMARDHHERKDGSGYPLGILLNDPMVEIVAVCDVYDALISPRPYRQTSYDNRTALEEITVMAEEGAISWEVVQALVAHNRKSKPHYTDCLVSKEKRGKPPDESVYGIIVPDTNGSLDEI